MANKEQQLQDRIDQVVDTVLYAPLGLLYEHEEIIPQLVKRGKSQVQLAKLLGKAAIDKEKPEATFSNVANMVNSAVARGVTEVGTRIGLAPDMPKQSSDSKDSQTDEPQKTSEAEAEQTTFPIKNYDDLRAKDIVKMLDDLSSDQLATVKAYEQKNRQRKTVLAKLDRLHA